MNTFSPNTSFLRVAAATPIPHIANVRKNVLEHKRLIDNARTHDVSLLVFPELSLTGYSIGDLLQSQHILDTSIDAICELALYTKGKPVAIVIGAPIMKGNGLYNCAVFIADGRILGVTPKRHLPTYKEFYEKRWFQAWTDEDSVISIGETPVPFGQPIFQIGKALIGIEICEDLWVADQPSIRLSARGATVICNPSASPENVTKADYRRELVSSTAARLMASYIYSGADPDESTMDVVFGGHALISESGRLLAERKPFDDTAHRLTIADIDIDHLIADRRRDTNFVTESNTAIQTGITPRQTNLLQAINPLPFVPSDPARLDEVFTIQAFGLKHRVEAAHIKKLVLGLSGGLDSTLALLVAVRAAHLLGVRPKELVLTLTMPSKASSKRTQSNAVRLAQALNIENREIPISSLSKAQLQAIGHDSITENTTFENTQARIRTALLFNTANEVGGMVLGTGDLSEIALGWCTFNGDHMSGYNVNASIPKTLVRHLVRYAADQLENQTAQKIIYDILDTPVSPELVGDGGTIQQKTEDIVGPYELHDFFLYHFIRWQTPLEKIQFLAMQAFEGQYTATEIAKWLTVFRTRFTSNQWKRSVMPDGPKVGSISLSPRGDWRMPSDASDADY